MEQIKIKGKALVRRISTSDQEYNSYIPNDRELFVITDGNKDSLYIGDGTSVAKNCLSLGFDLLEDGVAEYSIKGQMSSAGTLGFVWHDCVVDVTNKYFYVTLCDTDGSYIDPSKFSDIPVTTQFIGDKVQIGDTISCKSDYSQNFIGTITEIDSSNNNKLTVKLKDVISTIRTAGDGSHWFPEQYAYVKTEPYPENAYAWTGINTDSAYLWIPTKNSVGLTSVDIGGAAFSVGYNNRANEEGSISAGYGNIADGRYSSAFGRENKTGYCSHAEGYLNEATELYSHAEGTRNVSSGNASHAEGRENIASGARSHAEGYHTEASGAGSHAEGNNTTATGNASHAEGSDTVASGDFSHAEGGPVTSGGTTYNTEAVGTFSHAEGRGNIAGSEASHAEGKRNTVYGNGSHVEGQLNTIGTSNSARNNCHAEGYDNSIVSPAASAHVEGASNVVSGNRGHAEGEGNTASGTWQHVQGKYNVAMPDKTNADNSKTYYLDVVGGGTSNSHKNVSVLDSNGNLYLAGNVFTGTTSANGIVGGKRLPRIVVDTIEEDAIDPHRATWEAFPDAVAGDMLLQCTSLQLGDVELDALYICIGLDSTISPEQPAFVRIK